MKGKRCITKEMAKKEASRIGLAHWPILMEGHGIDPRAFVYVEDLFAESLGVDRKHLGWNDLSPIDVVEMWKMAGYQNSEKFRFQVSNKIIAKRGESIGFLQRYQEGLDWVREWRFNLEAMPRKTIAILARVSPEARHTLVADVGIGRSISQINRTRIRDLNWTGVRALEKLRREGTERSFLIRAALLPHRPAVALLRAHCKRGLIYPIGRERVREFCPTYPNLRVEVATRIAMGVSPKAISNNLLTRKEAHQWLLAGGPEMVEPNVIRESVIRWLVRGLELADHIPRDPMVARWLLHIHNRGAWSALIKPHRQPNGLTVRYLDIIDEIISDDLDLGVSTGVERAFTRTFARVAQANGEDHSPLCDNPFMDLPKRIRLLSSPADLVMEGRIMEHCAGGYITQVQEGLCWVLSLVSRQGRSTVEIRQGADGWWVAQHLGYQNTLPPPRHKAFLRAWLNRENQALQKDLT